MEKPKRMVSVYFHFDSFMIGLAFGLFLFYNRFP